MSESDRYTVGTKTSRTSRARCTTVQRVLVVAATALELAPRSKAATRSVCGVGPVEAAAATARASRGERPEAASSTSASPAPATLEPATLVIGSRGRLLRPRRPGVAVVLAVERAAPDPALLAAARRALPEAPRPADRDRSARVGGAAGCAEVEAMEGFAVLRAADAAGVPALELRAVSNASTTPTADWRIEEALDAARRRRPARCSRRSDA